MLSSESFRVVQPINGSEKRKVFLIKKSANVYDFALFLFAGNRMFIKIDQLSIN